jgi:hypothetical protein
LEKDDDNFNKEVFCSDIDDIQINQTINTGNVSNYGTVCNPPKIVEETTNSLLRRNGEH